MLVHDIGRDVEAPGKPLSEAAGQPPNGMLRSVRTEWHAYHESRRTPFGHDALYRRETRTIFIGDDTLQRVRERGLEVADRNADAARAEVECEDRSGPGCVMRDG